MNDNAGLYHALRSGQPVVPVFIFDTNILDGIEEQHDKRVCFIHDTLNQLQAELASMGSTLHVVYGTPVVAFKGLTDLYDIQAVYTNHDHEPYAQVRDTEIAALLIC
jgi:deoxyribodipyrimidine photo-lyase